MKWERDNRVERRLWLFLFTDHKHFTDIQNVALKRNAKYYTWNPSIGKRRNQWLHWILAALSRCCSWRTACSWCSGDLSCFASRPSLITNSSVSRSVVASQRNIVLFGTSLAGCALPNASRATANDFDAKFCSSGPDNEANRAAAKETKIWCYCI